jgi:hydroxyacyl-ACP dehydratase HTD2-like protein with hotdog domain
VTTLSEMITGWAPEPAEATETISAWPALALAGLLDCTPPVTGPGDPLPPLWHWLYFLGHPATGELGPDGHPAAGHFMPPIPERRRMYAGGRASYQGQLRCGDEITRRTELADCTVKRGRTGELLFVTVRSVFTSDGATVATEEQDLVYRSGPPAPGGAARAPAPGQQPAGPDAWRLRVVPDPVLLFRFSALTYNAHRIHYDERYATEAEGHPGLVVHGPLLALLCFELPRRHLPGQRVTRLSFRARSPLYAGQPCAVTGGPVTGAPVAGAPGNRGDGDGGDGCTMRVTGPDGTDVMTAEGCLTS